MNRTYLLTVICAVVFSVNSLGQNFKIEGTIHDSVTLNSVENVVAEAYTANEDNSHVFTAVSEGERSFTAIAVVTPNAGTPCGSCRQVLAEFSQNMVVIIGSPEGKYLRETTLAALLPESFDPGQYQLS